MVPGSAGGELYDGLMFGTGGAGGVVTVSEPAPIADGGGAVSRVGVVGV
jgi:hypothetical protein